MFLETTLWQKVKGLLSMISQELLEKVISPPTLLENLKYISLMHIMSGDTGDITTVNSYNSFNYSKEISLVNGRRVTDIIDARPRVSNYSVAAGTRSPLEFFGRNFNGGQHSSKNVLASDESLSLSYNYYLARADRLYVNKYGSFSIVTLVLPMTFPNFQHQSLMV